MHLTMPISFILGLELDHLSTKNVSAEDIFPMQIFLNVLIELVPSSEVSWADFALIVIAIVNLFGVSGQTLLLFEGFSTLLTFVV